MGFILPLIMLGIALVCIAILGSDGLWHNIITFFNVLVAGLLATNYYEPLTDWIDYQAPSFTYLLDFVILWFLFALFFVLFRLLTDLVSRVRVRFKKPVDLIGGYVVSVWTAWLLISFVTMSLHTTALSRNFFGGAFQPTPESRNLMGANDDDNPDVRMRKGFTPDREWLALVHKLSGPSGSMRRGDGKEHRFDEDARFILRYAQRRADYETKEGVRVNREYGQPAQ